MYFCEHNEARALGVWMFRGGDTTPAEWEAHLSDVETVSRWHARTKLRPAIVIVLLEGAGRPDAVTRQKLAQATEQPGYNPYLAFVSSSTLVRGTLTAMRWLQKTPHYELEIFADSPEAIAYLERRRGQPLPELTAAVARGRQALLRTSRAAL